MKQDWEVAVTQNENKLSGTVPNGYFSLVGFARVVNDPRAITTPGRCSSRQSFNDALAASGAKYIGATLDAKSKSTEVDGKLSGEVVKLPAGIMQYAAGLQLPKESASPIRARLSATGDIAGLGGATRRSIASARSPPCSAN